jgi:ATP adenylyltransferase
MGYILGEPDATQTAAPPKLLPGAAADCFLCRCAPEGDDLARLVVQRSAHSVTVLNRYPYNNGHLLIAPRSHRGRLDELSNAEHLQLIDTIRRMVGLLEKLLRPEGFNIGLNLGRAAGAGLPGHLHWHVVPRWVGDTSFMPSIGGVRVIPQSLEALWELLTTELNKQ